MLRFVALLGALVLAIHASADEAHGTQVISRSGTTECPESDKLRKGRFALVHFRETVEKSPDEDQDGTLRYDSYAARSPQVILLEDEEVIAGWVHGLEGACVNSTTVLVVPPEEAYQDDVTVRFEVEVLQVSDEEIEEPSMFDILDANGDGQISVEEFENYFKEFRKDELDEEGNPPMGLFMKEDINQNAFLNWEEFTGPKGTAPPSLAAAIVEREKADPELSKKQKGDPIKIVVKPNLHEDEDFDPSVTPPKQFEERFAGAADIAAAKAAAEKAAAEKATQEDAKAETAGEVNTASDEL